jgi:hypothetical protein
VCIEESVTPGRRPDEMGLLIPKYLAKTHDDRSREKETGRQGTRQEVGSGGTARRREGSQERKRRENSQRVDREAEFHRERKTRDHLQRIDRELRQKFLLSTGVHDLQAVWPGNPSAFARVPLQKMPKELLTQQNENLFVKGTSA